jgi:hypothetical protein
VVKAGVPVTDFHNPANNFVAQNDGAWFITDTGIGMQIATANGSKLIPDQNFPRVKGGYFP